jgi:peptide-methionine (S)-S-oxide reductase
MLSTGAIGAMLLTISLGLGVSPASAAEPAVRIPPPVVNAPPPAGGGLQNIVLAGGCFWGVQDVFQHTKGVTEALSGYAGGAKATAHYEIVATGQTGHAESVRVTYDPHRISLGKVLQIYFSVVQNPTELNYQGPDSGTQYRSEIFYANPEQKRVAEAYIAQLNKAHVFRAPIVTKVGPLTGFYRAETFHQDFATLHPDNMYILYNDAPKVQNLKRLFPDYYRKAPVTVLASSKASE